MSATSVAFKVLLAKKVDCSDRTTRNATKQMCLHTQFALAQLTAASMQLQRMPPFASSFTTYGFCVEPLISKRIVRPLLSTEDDSRKKGSW